jgi:hypothetical protein
MDEPLWPELVREVFIFVSILLAQTGMQEEPTMGITHFRSFMAGCLLVGLLAWSGTAQAVLITVEFEADILSVEAGFGGVVTTSDVIWGTYVYSENVGATSRTCPSCTNQAIPLAFNYTIGTFTGSSTIGQFFSSDGLYNPFVNNNQPGHNLIGDSINGLVPGVFGISMQPGLPGETASTIVPLTVPSLTTTIDGHLTIGYGLSSAPRGCTGKGCSFIHTNLTRLEVVQPIPAPSTMLLFGTGLAGLAVWRYRKTVKS